MRNYDDSTDRHIIERAIRNPSDRLRGPTAADVGKALRAAGVDPTHETGIQDAINAVHAATTWRVTRDGKPTGTQGTYNECWIAIHKGSSGNSVEWLMRHEGYAIEVV